MPWYYGCLWQETSIESYYLEDGRYVLKYHYMLQDDKEEVDYNAEQEICLKVFPHIKMTLGEVFEGIKWNDELLGYT